MSKKIISVLLALVMVLAMGTVALVSVSADLASLPEKPDNTKRYFFYMPDQWLDNDYAETAGIYWWEGTDAHSAWPGIAANKADHDGVYYYDVPSDVTKIIWNNLVDGGREPSLPIYQAAVQTVNVSSEYYDPGDSDVYPDGIPEEEGFDGMIYVTDCAQKSYDPFGGKLTYGGEWYYYYGDGEYGTAKNKADAEVVYSDPAFNLDEYVTDPGDGQVTEAPTGEPTEAPTAEPTEAPTAAPTAAPTVEPTEAPTAAPTEAPTAAPSNTVITVGGKDYPAQVGDTLTYTVDVTAARLFENIQAVVNYDPEKLELKLVTSDDPDLTDLEFQAATYCENINDGLIFNPGIAGSVKFNASKVAGYNFKSEKTLIYLTFEVKEDAASEIAISIEEMTIKGDGSESYFTNGQPAITEGITVKETLTGNTVPVEPPTQEPTEKPTEAPTAAPTEKPTAAPTEKPTAAPTEKPTAAPTVKPTDAPVDPTKAPTAVVDPTSDSNAPASSTTGGTGAPNTGAAAYIYVVVAVLAMAACAVVVLRKRVNG